MGRKVFTSFHYKPDNWRASQVRSMGKIEGNSIVTSNKWEEVTDGGDAAIKEWIETNMNGKSCVIVLVGENTAGRKWIDYEIKKAWADERGLVGIHIHKLANSLGDQARIGANPFSGFNVGDTNLSSIVKCYNPPYSTSTDAYDYIKKNIEDWVEEAIEIRNKY